MKFLLFTLLFSLLLPVAATAQSATCSNEIVEKISSRGIKIGVKVDELLSLFGSDEAQKVKLRNSSGAHYKHLGVEFFSAQPLPNDAKPDGRFEGITDYVFTILDGRLAGFTVRYSKPQWKDSKQFAETMIKALDLPTIDRWDEAHRLYCGDYKVMALGGAFYVDDQRINKIIADRKEKYEEDQRIADLKKFRP